jgi:hypothetical protein
VGSPRQRWVAQLIERCKAQGFRTEELKAGNGVHVFPKDGVSKPVCLFYGSREIEYQNRRSALRRIGVTFDEHKAKVTA